MPGQIIRRGKNKYLVRIPLGSSADGKRLYHNKTINGTKKDAQRYRTKILRKRDLGELVEPSKELLGLYLERWLETAARPRIAPSTFATYSNYVSIYLKPGLGDKGLSELEALEIQEFYNGLGDKGLSPKTVKNIHGVFTNALKQAVKWQLIRTNPADHVDLPKDERREMQVFTREQAAQFMEATIYSPHKALFSLLLSSGMRPGEALGLKWGDVDMKAGRVHVQRALSKTKTGWVLREPKTARSRRAIPLPPSVMNDLKEHRAAQLEERLKTGSYNDRDLVFADRTGEPLSPKEVYRKHFIPLLRDAGLPKIRMYDLRHTCATLLLAAGENPKVVSERLGHASITLTLDTYSHVLPDMQDRATAKLENILFGAPHTHCTQAKIEGPKKP